ncbi:hypothetical protein [Hydrogenoanaerobacterium sp.]|uniref:hypothetical protein n=1 Tax=Hydrogenoanaerobacterium sp. TaxID=2953763 RepID=UPI002898ED30|nr:hypothetical protein [Hydrogenoanaerobacterium sp.]
MNNDFTPDEIIFIYRHFKNELRKVEPLRNNQPSAINGLNRGILEPIVKKLEALYPALRALEC